MYDFVSASHGAPPWGGETSHEIILGRQAFGDGHRTSISLEDAFWTSLKEIAQERRETLQNLITEHQRQSAIC